MEKQIDSLIVQFQKVRKSSAQQDIYIINSVYGEKGKMIESEFIKLIHAYGYSHKFKRLKDIHFEGKENFTKFVDFIVQTYHLNNIHLVDLKNSLKQVLSADHLNLSECFYQNRETRGPKLKKSRSLLNRVFSF